MRVALKLANRQKQKEGGSLLIDTQPEDTVDLQLSNLLRHHQKEIVEDTE